ncbi:hypothetical protein FBU59_002653 [Linderina macrospora]|uniref:Uncharacterized protein n=1 Tax=Linderina macrospora TaxID=4868 RepID=A0ACC1JAJ0_9FUNG|nr:hypothetical protein FBU59_002653 [Linderina macrospora]
MKCGKLHLTTEFRVVIFNQSKLPMFIDKEIADMAINVQYVRPRGDLPPIPIRCLRVLELFQIEDAIPWQLFETLRGVLNFESLESLLLEFVHRAETTIGFPGFSWSILFPRLSRLNVTGTAYVYSDIFGYFKDQHFDELVIVDDPIFFEKLSEHTLENVKVLRISHPTGTPFVDTYSVEMAEHLYNLQSSVEQAIIRQIRLPLPQLIAWEDLLLLDITASIADKYGLINLILQLPQLRTLVIDCFSMARADYRLTKFKDQNIAFDELGKVEKPVKSGPISEHLSRLELKAARDFDVYGFSELLSRLPNVNMVRINPEMIDRVVGMLLRDFKVTREIVFMQ